ncbi:MAG: hypothetical protein ACM3Q1_13455 [Bacteroidales bacterium]
MSAIDSQNYSLNGASAQVFPKTMVTRVTGPGYEERVARMKEALEGAYSRPAGDVPEGYGTYAEVKVNGKVVASVANSGAATIFSNELGSRIGGQLGMQGEGPSFARQRAEQIAKTVGGSVVKSTSAMTEAEWAARPPIRTIVDYEAMKADPLYEVWRKMSAVGSAFTAQTLAQESGS